MNSTPPALEAPEPGREPPAAVFAAANASDTSLWRAFVVKLKNQDSEYYDKSFPFWTVLAPAIWLYVVWALMLGMLLTVGYLTVDKAPNALEGLVADLKGAELDLAARRAALAFSGVTLAITMALALTSLFWGFMSWVGKSGAFRTCVLLGVASFLGLSLWVSWSAATNLQPFTSALGQELLAQGPAQLDAPQAQHVPLMMFLLSCVVPGILLAGATFLLQPMEAPGSLETRRSQVHLLLKRLRELDQMLYIGALALVFGTLQLSSGLSVGLVSMPKAADLKVRADLCKAMGPSSTASSPFFAPSAAKSGSARSAAAFDAHCQDLPARVLRLDSAESLRELVHGITICFGLAFSALLAAIYVPTLIGLRSMYEPRQQELSKDEPTRAASSANLAVEPLNRIAAVAATLSPLFAGLLANTLAGS
jgi:hypothetical protein